MSRARDDDLLRIVVLVLGAIVLLPALLMVLAMPMMGAGMMGWGGMMGGWGGGMMDGSGYSLWWGLGMMLVWLLVLLAIGYGGYRLLGRHAPPTERADPALEELRLAYARGDLTDEEYESRRQALQREE